MMMVSVYVCHGYIDSVGFNYVMRPQPALNFYSLEFELVGNVIFPIMTLF